MKQRIFIWLFRKELERCQDLIDQHKSTANGEISKVKHEANLVKKQFGLNKRIFEIDNGAKIIGIETNKNNEELFVVESISRSSLTIKLYGSSYQGISGLPRIMATINERPTVEDNYIYYTRNIHIDDILMTDNNVGNGSIAMKYFLEVIDNLNKVYKMNIKYIDGYLSSMDKDHFDRSEHYYNKFGFEVSFNEKGDSGRIMKTIME